MKIIWRFGYIHEYTYLKFAQMFQNHYKSTKKYQNLISFDQAPQLPYGYPTSILLAMVPWLWFKLINPRVPKSMIV